MLLLLLLLLCLFGSTNELFLSSAARYFPFFFPLDRRLFSFLFFFYFKYNFLILFSPSFSAASFFCFASRRARGCLVGKRQRLVSAPCIAASTSSLLLQNQAPSSVFFY
jgi:hypothetical protein